MSPAPSVLQDDSPPTPITPLIHSRPSADRRLPVPLTSLIGRDDECARIEALLARPDVRLLTMSGPAGVGKTRLALSALAALEHDPSASSAQAFPDGAWFVPLAAITDPALVPAAIAQTLGVRESSERSFVGGLKTRLHDATALLLLDNLEQVLGAAPFIVDLLIACPALKVVVTSRAMLHVAGEHAFAVEPLPLPTVDGSLSLAELAACPAVALFLERVQAHQPDVALTAANAPTIAELCHRLDGLPLAIELAAARAKVVPPAMLLSRLSDRLDLLTGGCRDQPARLHTLRAAIAWSYDLLSAEEQALFRRLAVFVGGFSLDAAEAVGRNEKRGTRSEDENDASSLLAPRSSALDGIAALVDHHMLVAETGANGTPRFRMLESIRAFGLEQLARNGEESEARERHAAFFTNFVVRVAEPRADWGFPAPLRHVAANLDNIRSTLSWLHIAGEYDRLLHCNWMLWPFWFSHGFLSEGRRWMDAAVAAGREDSAHADLLGKALYGAAWLALEQGDDDMARAHGEESLALARERGDHEGIACVLGPLSFLAHQQGDLDRATALNRKALAIKRTLDDVEGASITLTYLAHIALDRGDLDEATSLGQEALATHRALGNRRRVALTLDILGDVAHHRGDDADATACLDEALTILRDLPGTRGIAGVLDHLGVLARKRADYAQAWACHREALALRQELGNPGGVAAWLEAVAALLAECRQPEAAARLFGTASAIRERVRRPLSPLLAQEYAQTRSTLRRDLGESMYTSAWNADRDRAADDAIAGAMAALEGVLSEGVPAPPNVPPPPFGLTAREMDVLRLLTCRATDKEIAEALYISPRTVGRHVTNIFNKVGVRSRRDAADLAQDHGLI